MNNNLTDLNQKSFEKIKTWIQNHTHDMVEFERILTANRALAPENGGEGEWKKCKAIEKYLTENGISNFEHFDAPDDRVPEKTRPNLVATIPGKNQDYNIWGCAHMDVVPVGEAKLWNTDPWKVVENGDKIFGRGVEDNQQGLCSGVLAALSFVKQQIVPEHTIKLLFMADEEVGSVYGMNFLIKEHKEIFGLNDRILIPDGGDSKGETIEIAEKNIFWLEFHTIGKQAHGSRPDLGKNAMLAGCDLALQINDLENVFNHKNPLFEVQTSTFQPTKKMQNVEGVNFIPGDDVFCCDCRINPEYKLDEVRAEVLKRVHAVEKKYGVKVEVKELQAEESKATPLDAPVAQELKTAIKNVHGIEAKFVGVGGGTVAAGLRNLGLNAVVWSTLDEMAHQPNEYCIVKNIGTDALTMAYLALM